MSKISLFMQRWSRLKAEEREVAAPAVTPGQQDLPTLDSLTPDSDFSAFLQPEVDAATRQSALKKLFMTDRYRSMDMLDVYVDDYSKPALLPTDMLAKLEHVRKLLNPQETPDNHSQKTLPDHFKENLPQQAERLADAAPSAAPEEGEPLVQPKNHNEP